MSITLRAVLFFGLLVSSAISSSKTKPHGHTGVLDHYDGKPIPMKITAEQSKKLDSGKPVTFTESGGKSGRGLVIQDVNASQPLVMSRIRDLPLYSKMVPHVKKVDIYETTKFINGTTKQGAQFDIGLLGMKFTYFLKLTHEPKYKTLTWTLDYTKNSDFDDNVGHWQITPHPTKAGWTRVLYSTKVKLFPWIPNFVVTFITTKALVESTTWVKREAELEAAKASSKDFDPKEAKEALKKMLPSWMIKGGSTSEKEGPALDSSRGNQEKDIPHTRQATLGGLLHPFFKMRLSLKGL